MNRWAKVIFLTTFLFVGIGFGALHTHATEYRVIDLGDLPGGSNFSHALAIDNAGNVAGFSSAFNGERAFLWDRKTHQLQDLGALPNGPAISFYDMGMNNNGRIVGTYRTEQGDFSFIWDRSNGMRDLSVVIRSVDIRRASDINDNGHVVGEYFDPDLKFPRGFLWDTQTLKSIRSFNGGRSQALAVNDKDQVVGWSTSELGKSAFIWDDTKTPKLQDLGVPVVGGLSGKLAEIAIARDINNSGQVVGDSSEFGPPPRERAFVWDETSMVQHIVTGVVLSPWALGINNSGQVVGTRPIVVDDDVSLLSDTERTAFIWDKTNERRDLMDLAELDVLMKDKIRLSVASDINDTGYIICDGAVDGIQHAVLLEPLGPTEFTDTDNDGIANIHDQDDDGDGLPDSYEALYDDFLDPVDPTDAGNDIDGDGASFLVEYRKGTDPLDPNAFSFKDDFNGDGKADIFWHHGENGQNWVHLMDGQRIASARQVNSEKDLNWKPLAIGDFNGDGKSDVFWRHARNGKNVVYLMDGQSIVRRTRVNTLRDSSWRMLGAGDFDGDGKSDVFWRHAKTGNNVVYLMDGAQIRTSKLVNTVPNNAWQVVDFGDLDGDGKTDVLWHHGRSGKIQVFLMDGVKIKASHTIKTIPDLRWTIAGTGDFDGDGKDDICLRNVRSGQNFIYLMNGSKILTKGLVNTVRSKHWRIERIADYNGDGRSDLFWRNNRTGVNWLYIMDGLRIKSSVKVNTIGTLWNVVGN